MHHLPPLISDLAIILIVASIVTIIFKRLKQPLVLGYIVAGFLAGPHMAYMPTVQDTTSIETWSSIGVIFLMFTLGLEFSMKKIVAMGMRPVVAAVLVMTAMIGVGAMVGRMFSWGSIDSLFLGGMLAMSSTTIIYKAFDDLGLRQRRFAGEVLSVLILEDILGILLMVILSATAVSQQFEGNELITSLLTLGFFLVLWFVVGIYVVPWFLRKNRRFMSGETLLMVSLGLCFLLVVMADKAGYSAAFGAFMMGSILAETVEAEAIEHVVAPVKDLFGAIFFVSVGMMVNPQVLFDYWPAIAAITAAILLGQSILGTGAFLVAGHPLQRAMLCGFSLAQIGEFAFIIAGMGVALGVTSEFLYPVVVAVSIVTTFLTPYMIKAATPAFEILHSRLPQGLHKYARTCATDATNTVQPARSIASISSPWFEQLRSVLLQTAVYLVLTIATIALCLTALLPVMRQLLGHWPGNAVTGLVAIGSSLLFLRPVVMRKNHSASARIIKQHLRGRLGLRALQMLRFALAVYAVWYVIEYLSPYRWYWHVLAATLIVLLSMKSRAVKYYSIRMERNFMHNLRGREADYRRRNASKAYARRLEARDVHFARLTVPPLSTWAGQTLMELDFAQRYGILVAAILRADHRINTPDGHNRIFPSDVLEVIADDDSLEVFAREMAVHVSTPPTSDLSDHTLRLRRLMVGAQSALLGKTIAESGLRSVLNCTVVGFEDDEGNINLATASQTIERHAVLWLVGEMPDLRRAEAAISGRAT